MLSHFIGVSIHFEFHRTLFSNTTQPTMKLAFTLLTIASLATTILSQDELSANNDEQAICETNVRAKDQRSRPGKRQLV